MDLEKGTLVTPVVRLVRPLGHGGMGAVWVAEHTGLRTDVVVKFMSTALSTDPVSIARFSREASAAAAVKSPHVVFHAPRGAGAADVEKKLVIREGEHGRAEAVLFADLHAPPAGVGSRAAPPAPPASSEGASSASGSGRKTAAVVVGAAGLAGVIVGSVFGGLSFSAWSSSKSDCNGTPCANHAQAVTDHDIAVRDATISDVGLIAGGALVAGGVVLYLTAPSSEHADPAARASTMPTLRFAPRLGRDRAGLSFEGTF